MQRWPALLLAPDYRRRTRATPASVRRVRAPAAACWPRLAGDAMRGVLVPARPHTWRQTPLRRPARTRVESSSIDDEPRARERTMGSRALRRSPPRRLPNPAAKFLWNDLDDSQELLCLVCSLLLKRLQLRGHLVSPGVVRPRVERRQVHS